VTLSEFQLTRALLAIYCAVFLVSAALLFMAQPMIARLVLPLFGGSPAVWTTSMLYFQAMLLGGYAYAHWLTKLASLKTQLIVHSIVIAVPLALLPMAVPDGWTVDSTTPVASLLLLLVIAFGGPFFVVTTTSPLLQRWFSQTTHQSAADPYFLYAISNFGSMVALLGYPFVAEPLLGLSDQVTWWAWGYGLLCLGVVCSAVLTWHQRKAIDEPAGERAASKASNDTQSPSGKDRLIWILLAFLPSSWMLSTTSRLTTNIAPMPLLWIIPLSLYLLTFILVFAKRQVISHNWVLRLLPFALILLSVSLLITGQWQLMAVEVGVFFLATMACHGELARRRPAAEHLTDFYLMMSIGGALGGLFNAVLAPLLFSAYIEFPIVVAIVCWMRPEPHEESDAAGSRVDMILLVVVTLVIFATLNSFVIEKSVAMTMIVAGSIPILVVLHFWGYPQLNAFVLLFVFCWDQFDPGPNYIIVERARSFFGVHTVTDDAERLDEVGQPLPRHRRLMHGTTQHGCQSLDQSRKREPLAYYNSIGPLGDVFKAFGNGPADDQKYEAAVIGLGTGAMGAYATKHRRFTFYEIDPIVKRLAAEDPQASEPPLFTFLKDSEQKDHQVIVGDGRLRIAEADDAAYSMIVLDAFSSDAVPIHLITIEAMELYFRKLDTTGLLVIHISNRYMDLSRVLSANSKQLGLTAMIRRELAPTQKELDARLRLGITTSTYVVIGRDIEHVRPLVGLHDWKRLKPTAESVVWTDDFSNVLSVLRWNPEAISRGE
jgi:hypothetical protein